MFEEAHENLEGLRRLFAGEASPVEAERAAAHLTSCRGCWLLAVRALAAQKARGPVAVQGPLRPLVDLHEVEQARLQEWLEAQAMWAEMQSLSTKARRDKARLTRSLHTIGFLEVLLEEGAAGAPAESEELFYLALLVSQQLPSPRVSVELKNDLCAECCAEIANARRRLAKWPAARDALKKGSEYVERGSKNGVAEGKVLCVAGALEDDLGNTEEAVKLLRQAAGLFEAASQTFLRSRTLTQLAYVLVDADPAESFFLDLVYLFGFYLRKGQKTEAIAVCRRAIQELSLLDDEEGSGETARDQMQTVWRGLEEEVKKGNIDLGATTVLRNYIKAHWRTPASNPPFSRQ